VTAINNVTMGVDLITKISQLPPDVPVDKNVLIKFSISKLNMPEGTYKDPLANSNAADDEASKKNIEAEITAAAQAKGVTPEQFIEEMAAQFETTPEELIADIKNNGGTLAAFMAQIDAGVKAKEGAAV